MVSGLIFDKDGTLFDFHATWGNWAACLLRDLADGDALRAARLAEALGYDLALGRFRPDSTVIAHTPTEIAESLLPLMPGKTIAALVAQMNTLSVDAPQVPATALVPLFEELRGRGLRIGLATNDAEAAAHAHLAGAGVDALFDYVAGFDSGHGGKPYPGMLLAFARAHGLEPGAVAMVGDSCHDLIAGRAAGMRPVAVLTGVASHDDLAPLAEVVLPDIGHLPAWLDGL